jgi:hypothetical protein
MDGYTYLLLNCAFQTTYTVLERLYDTPCRPLHRWLTIACVLAMLQLYLNKLMKTLNLGKWSMVYYNNIIAIPLLIPCVLYFREFDTVLDSYALSSSSSHRATRCRSTLTRT